MPEEFDLIVVGGGVGGSALARCMAESGARVLVLEREMQFKDRVRGEFVSPWGVAEAKKLGIEGPLREAGAHEVPWVNFYEGSQLMLHRPVASTTPQQLPCMAFYHPRAQEVLIEAAARAGAVVKRGATVREVRPGALARVVVEENGRSIERHARLVVGADGRSSVVRASAGFQIQRDPEDMMVAGLLMEHMAVADDIGHIVTNSQLGQIAAIFPQGGGRARNYFCYHAGTLARFQGENDLPRFIESCVKAGLNPSFYEGAKPAGPLATFSGAETWVEHPYRNGVALLGDAAACTDPSWGQGLCQTFRDARVLRDALRATADWDAAGHAYATEHDRYARVTHLSTLWYTALYVGLGAEADARRARAMPLIAQDPSRQPDTLFSGPDVPMDESVRQRFFAED